VEPDRHGARPRRLARRAEGELILHCGEFLWIDGKMQPAGEHGDYFYVRRPRTIAPWSQPVELEDNPAVKLFEILRTWNFVRGDVDVMLVLGWIGVGALWRGARLAAERSFSSATPARASPSCTGCSRPS
jgi:hypothetical protein